MIHHLVISIDRLLAAPDEDLQQLFDCPAEAARLGLMKKKAAGEVYAPPEGCEGFDPVKGCPGHPQESDLKTTQQ